MKKPTILILDDEELASSYLKEVIDDVKKNNFFFSNFDVLTSNNYNNFILKVKEFLPEIIFLDIEMPFKNGLDIAKEIRKEKINMGYSNENLPIIIFSTAYDNYGFQAFSVEAFDYILKPVEEEKIDYLLKKIENIHSVNLRDLVDFIKVPSSGLEIEIPLKDILFFKSDMKYTTVVTLKKEYLINKTLLSLEEKYPQFIKIHRAFLLNPNFISKFYKKDTNWFVSLKNHEEHLPVSRRQKTEIEKKINNFQLLD